MRKVFGDYLKKFESVEIIHRNKAQNTKAAVFLDDRQEFWVPYLLKNAAWFLGDSWNIYYFCTNKNEAWLKNLIQEMNWDIKIYNIGLPEINAQVFNQTFTDSVFWNLFTEDHILSLEFDSLLLKKWDDKWLQYDMIGAPCGEIKSDTEFTMNGGMCLRNRQKMLEALAHTPYIGGPEDVYFSGVLRELGASLPSANESAKFSVENFVVAPPFGFHGTDKLYLSDADAKKITDESIIDYRKPNVFLCSPVYKWPPHPKFAESVAACQKDPRMNVVFRACAGDAHIERARAMLLEQYLRKDQDWDWMVMIDSDIEFNPDIIYGMINRGKDCIGAAYPFKAPEGTPKHKQPVVRPLSSDEPIQDGVTRMRYLGGGFTICSDAQISRLCSYYNDLRFFVNPDIKQGESSGLTFGLWNPVLVDQPDWGIDESTGKMKQEMLSEDYSFCQRILDMGDDIWLDLCAVIAHWDGDNCYTLDTRPTNMETTNVEEVPITDLPASA